MSSASMRRVATELGVDPMALYRHVRSKDALLDGVVEVLWREVPPPPRRQDNWAEPLRSFAHELRAVVNAHSSAAPLLCVRPVFPRPALEAFDILLSNIRDASFDDVRASDLPLPENTPTKLVRAAYAVCACEPDADFTFVLDLILHGAQELKREN